MLIAAGGVAGGRRGEAQALLAWELPALQLPALCVDDALEQRVRARRGRPRAPDVAPAAAVAEDDVRALCTAPAAACRLRARVLGLVLHPGYSSHVTVMFYCQTNNGLKVVERTGCLYVEFIY